MDDYTAIRTLELNFIISRGGIIYPKVAGYRPTELECEAINELCAEWDYGYSPNDNFLNKRVL